MKSIFFVVTLKVLENKNDKRTWAWFESIEDAERCILSNDADIFENYYDYALIEETKEGLFGFTENMTWYQVSYENGNHDPKFIQKISTPDFAKNVVGFSIG